MLDSIFRGVFDTQFTTVISPDKFLLCLGVSLVLGWILSRMTGWHSESGSSFSAALALLPGAVCVVIMMVNGNVGTGVAVAGAFSLIRFRSAPGTGREICAIFIAMGTGLMAGMGYLAYAAVFTLIMGAMLMLYPGLTKNAVMYRQLRITIPENLDYVGVFDPILENYTSNFQLKQVKSINMGSMFRLTYDLTLPETASEKRLLDELRTRNGNLEISLCSQEPSAEGL